MKVTKIRTFYCKSVLWFVEPELNLGRDNDRTFYRKSVLWNLKKYESGHDKDILL